MANADTLVALLDAIGNAIRAKTGGTAKLTLAEMPDEIAGIETALRVDASILKFPIFNGTLSTTERARQFKRLVDSLDTDGLSVFGLMFNNTVVIDMNTQTQENVPSFAFDTSSATNMQSMFDGFGFSYSSSFTMADIDLTAFDTSKVKSFNRMFANFGARTLDISSFNTSAGTNFTDMFTSSDVGTIITGEGWTQAGASSDSARAKFPSYYRDEAGGVYQTGKVIPDGAHTYTKVS